MKKFGVFGVVIAFGVLLWGCSSQTSQDPVSPAGYGSGSGVPILHMTIGSPTNVVAVVTGQSVTISWNSVAAADSYHVAITLNGNPYLSVVQTPLSLVLSNLPFGVYSVTVAAIVGTLPEGTASDPVTFTLSSVLPPTVTVIATPIPICPRTGQWVTVKFSGVVTNSAGGASYELTDEYNKIHYTGTVPAGPYSVKLKLKDRRFGFDKDGRQYTFTITTTNSAGTATATVVVTVPRDKGYRGRDDDDDRDDGWDH